jgi:hypothetical protein
VTGFCASAAAGHWVEPQRQMSISWFRSTAVSRAGLHQSCYGTAMRKTRGSPCLRGYKSDSAMDWSHAEAQPNHWAQPSAPH